MIRGSFRQDGSRRRPYINAFVEIPALQCSGEVAFLVDTGADAILLAPRDAILLGVDTQLLSPGLPSTGVGGTTDTVYAEATLTLGALRYDLTLRVLSPRTSQQHETLGRIPSLLGRDILSRFALFMEERTNRVLLLEPHEADELALPS